VIRDEMKDTDKQEFTLRSISSAGLKVHEREIWKAYVWE
jgi:hypothetical protein